MRRGELGNTRDVKSLGVCRHCFKAVGRTPAGVLVHIWKSSRTCGRGKGEKVTKVAELRVRGGTQ